jgi:1-acyl-sn-glycerol-3-phosphate acyltransferase
METLSPQARSIAASSSDIRTPSPVLLALYQMSVRLRLGWNFRSLRIANAERFPTDAQPLIVFMNHPSWWDPAPSMLLHHEFRPTGRLFAPVDEAALARAGYLRRLGFFPIRTGSVSGARKFLKDARHLLGIPGAVLWVTPEGEFTDPRERPLRLRRGLAKLISTLDEVTILPMALEYPFWDGTRPEILTSFGEPIRIRDGQAKTTAEWQRILAQSLTDTQDELAELVVARQANRFRVLFFGPLGVRGLVRLLRDMKPLFAKRLPGKTKGQP